MKSLWKLSICDLAARSGIHSQDELAVRMEYDRSYVSRVFNYKVPLTDEFAERLANVLEGSEPWDFKPDYDGLSETEQKLVQAFRLVPRDERPRVLRSLLALLQVERNSSAA